MERKEADVYKRQRDLAPCCPGADIRDGRLLNGRQSVNDLKNWISKLRHWERFA